MTVLATHLPRTSDDVESRTFRLSRLIGLMESALAWYERKMEERALEGLSMSELKDIGYPTGSRDGSSVHDATRRR